MIKYTKNEDFFKETNVKNCYWMGFIAADGCISSDKGIENSRLCIDLKSTDAILLEAFRKDIEYTGVIRYNTTKPYIFKENNKSRLPAGYILKSCKKVRLSLHSISKYYNDLKKHANIEARKSDTLLPPNLIRFEDKIAYITGYFDGDGCLYWHKQQKTWHIKIVGTKELLQWVKEIIEPFTSSKIGIYKFGRLGTNTYELRIGTTKGTQQFLDLMSCAIYSPLRRKHDFNAYWEAKKGVVEHGNT